jgi:hypothetical protein
LLRLSICKLYETSHFLPTYVLYYPETLQNSAVNNLLLDISLILWEATVTGSYRALTSIVIIVIITASVVWCQSSWLQIQRSRGPFSLISTTEELLGIAAPV